MDIRHCLLSHIPGVIVTDGDSSIPQNGQDEDQVVGTGRCLSSSSNKRKVIVAAKHLCGLATDLAIRSLQSLYTSDPSCAEGLVIATCCHHACRYVDYCGMEYLHEQGFTPAEFEVMR
jgi:hypothetical protein